MNRLTRQQQDEIMGDMNEDIVKILLEEDYNISLTKTEKNFEMDFIDNLGNYYEIKSRNNEYKKYPDTMVGYNKICFARHSDKDCIFIFVFTDGIYSYQFDRTDYFIPKMGGRCDRGKKEYKKYIYIPIEKLKCLKTF